MAISYRKGGRPYAVADIDFSNDAELLFWDTFYKACSNFRYIEIIALSRALEVSVRTVENWKYGLTFPRKGIAQQVIDWVSRGKPMKKISPSQAISDML